MCSAIHKVYSKFSETYVFLNQGKFRQNGGCGYILKPKVMRNLPTDTGSYMMLMLVWGSYQLVK